MARRVACSTNFPEAKKASAEINLCYIFIALYSSCDCHVMPVHSQHRWL